MKFIKKAINWFTDNRFFGLFLRRLLWIFKSRAFWVVITSLAGLLLGICVLYLSYTVDPPNNTKSFWKWIFGTLKSHPTIILFVSSLLTAFVLWLFRNHDIVMGLDLNMYHEAIKNIQNENTSQGLRQAAFVTLVELREKKMWRKKIKTQVFPGAMLMGLKLSGADLSETILSGANLKGIDLYNADLTKAELRDTNLIAANLDDAILNQANLDGADLTQASLVSSKLLKTDLHYAELIEAKLNHADLTGAKLDKANLTKANLYDTTLDKANLSNANLTEAKLNNATLTNSKLIKAILNNATLHGTNLTRANLTDANLAGADLTHAKLTNAYYYESEEAMGNNERTPVTKRWLRERAAKNIESAKGIIEDTYLANADLQGADLQGYYLYKITLTLTNLTEANLTNANLTKATLNEVNLTDVILKETDLLNANLYESYYYKDGEAKEKDERTPVTKKWLRERGALNVDTVKDIDEE